MFKVFYYLPFGSAGFPFSWQLSALVYILQLKYSTAPANQMSSNRFMRHSLIYTHTYIYTHIYIYARPYIIHQGIHSFIHYANGFIIGPKIESEAAKLKPQATCHTLFIGELISIFFDYLLVLDSSFRFFFSLSLSLLGLFVLSLNYFLHIIRK